jgi:hypothetical protein
MRRCGEGDAVQITEVSVVGVRSSVLVFQRRDTPLRFVLIPTIHFGQQAYYRQIGDRLSRCQLIVAEGEDGPSSTGFEYAIALRISRQWRGGTLVHQDINYEALGVPVVWPDDLRSTGRRQGLGWWGWLDLVVLVPFLVLTMAVGGRTWLLRQNFEVSDSSEPRLRWSLMSKALIEKRDQYLVNALTRIDNERRDEAIDVGVVYGAAHFPAIVRVLRDQLGYHAQRGGDWLTAIDF